MRLHSSVLRATLCLAALTVGCGGDGGDAPTSPAPAPARTTLTLNLQFVEVIEDCDGIEGDGDFKLSVLVYSNIFPTDLIYRQTVNLGPGGRTPVLGKRSYTVPAVDSVAIYVELQATELDKSITGEEYNDDRLDFAIAVLTHRYIDGVWSYLGPRELTLGSAGCRVRLYWSAAAS